MNMNINDINANDDEILDCLIHLRQIHNIESFTIDQLHDRISMEYHKTFHKKVIELAFAVYNDEIFQ